MRKEGGLALNEITSLMLQSSFHKGKLYKNNGMSVSKDF